MTYAHLLKISTTEYVKGIEMVMESLEDLWLKFAYGDVYGHLIPEISSKQLHNNLRRR